MTENKTAAAKKKTTKNQKGPRKRIENGDEKNRIEHYTPCVVLVIVRVCTAKTAKRGCDRCLTWCSVKDFSNENNSKKKTDKPHARHKKRIYDG